MEEPREVTITMNDRFFTTDLPVEDEKLIIHFQPFSVSFLLAI